VRGVVDSPDLPLNVSRDVLQQNAQVRAIRKRLVRKLLHALGELLEQDRERYTRFWDAFGLIVKEGIWLGEDEDGRIAKVSLFHTTHGDEPSTLAEIAGRTSGDTIFYLTGRDRDLLRGSPLLEGARKRGQEVLLLTDPVDEWVVQRLTGFDKKKLAALDRGEAELGAAEKEALEQRERELRDTLSAVEKALAGKVGSVRLTGRLAESPACLVTPEHGLSPNLERILRATNQEVPKTERILELNPDHPLVEKLAALQEKDAQSPRIADLAELIHAQALLAEGSPLPDPARFSRLVSELVVAGLG
jgi:molecular chaperone HtpG